MFSGILDFIDIDWCFSFMTLETFDLRYWKLSKGTHKIMIQYVIYNTSYLAVQKLDDEIIKNIKTITVLPYYYRYE